MSETLTAGIARWFLQLAIDVNRWRSHRLSSGQRAIWMLNGALIGGAGALLVALRGVHPIIPSMRVPLWALLIGFAAAERFVVHVHFRHSAHSISLAEIPLVFGLLFASGQDVVVSAAIGRLLVLGIHRKLPPIRLAFNLGLFLLWGYIAVAVSHAVVEEANGVVPVVWAAAVTAVAVCSLATALLITTAVSLSEGRLALRQVFKTFGFDLAAAVANASVSLCAARLVFHDWNAGILMVIPIGAMFITFRAYITERQRHERVEFLYESARTLSHSPELAPALQGLLGQALDAFRAEVAELILFSPDGDDALRTTVRAQGQTRALEDVEPEVVAQLRLLIEQQGLGASPVSAIASGALGAYLESRDLSGGLFAVLKGERSWIGAMMLGNPSGVVHNFSPEDLRLFETLANNTSVALENDRLGHTVWQLKELQRELEHQASHDALTDLANRGLFAARVRETLQAGDGSVAVVFIDIDDFKTVNDSLGHGAGDELLVAVAGRLSDCVRPDDVVARLGGDEFAVMLELGESPMEAVEVAERFIRRLTERFSIAGHNISVRASAGIATGERGAIEPEELIRNADVAMYRAKQAGKHSYQVFETGMEVPVIKRHRLKQRLREAVKEDSFIVHYQPIVALQTGEAVAYEALVRWLDGPRGPVQPHAFIPIAEEMGAIVPIGRSVLQRACLEAQQWQHGAARNPSVHVNLSPVELRDAGFLAGVTACLDRSGLRPEQLVLEITESVVLREPEKSIAKLKELRKLGVRLALDDFGTGYSSLSHLRLLPIDWLKIGRPFVDGLEQGGVDRLFVRMIVDLAASLGLGVVAEGIENRGQLTSLRDLGCGYGQGFYLGSPAELEPSGAAPATTYVQLV